jgi:glucoamylase
MIKVMGPIQSINPAPKGPQQPQSWSRADKDGIGTARSLSSPIWYTVANGIVTEEVWNAPNRTNPTFSKGGPTGSAMPLAWAHAEYIKLVRSVSDGEVFDRLDVVAKHYLNPHQPSSLEIWNFDYRPSQMKAGNTLRFLLGGNFRLRLTTDNWANFADLPATKMVGIYFVDHKTDPREVGKTIQFTMFWLDSQTWQGGDNFALTIVA